MPSLTHTAQLTSALRIAVMRTARRLRNERSDSTLSIGALAALGTLDRVGPLTPGELAEHERVQPPSMTRMLAHLEATAAAAGAEAMVLETGTEQPEAIALYVSAGYSPIPGFGYHREAPESRCFGKLLPAAERASAG